MDHDMHELTKDTIAITARTGQVPGCLVATQYMNIEFQR